MICQFLVIGCFFLLVWVSRGGSTVHRPLADSGCASPGRGLNWSETMITVVEAFLYWDMMFVWHKMGWDTKQQGRMSLVAPKLNWHSSTNTCQVALTQTVVSGCLVQGVWPVLVVAIYFTWLEGGSRLFALCGLFVGNSSSTPKSVFVGRTKKLKWKSRYVWVHVSADLHIILKIPVDTEMSLAQFKLPNGICPCFLWTHKHRLFQSTETALHYPGWYAYVEKFVVNKMDGRQGNEVGGMAEIIGPIQISHEVWLRQWRLSLLFENPQTPTIPIHLNSPAFSWLIYVTFSTHVLDCICSGLGAVCCMIVRRTHIDAILI